MIDIIKEYLVSVGFHADEKSFDEAKKRLKELEKLMGDFSKTAVGRFALAGAAVEAFALAAGVALGKFMSDVAAADQQVEIFARQMLTTERNARSLKAVMSAMNIKSLDDLADINLNPELRAQFLALRDVSKGLEPGKDIQDSMQDIRKMGYEIQKFQVISMYALQYIGGYLAKYLSGPMSKMVAGMEKFNNKFKANIKQYSEGIAKFLSHFGRMAVTAVKLLDLAGKLFGRVSDFLSVLNKLPSSIKLITGAVTLLGIALRTGPWGMFLSAATAIMLLADDYFTWKEGGESALPEMWEGMETVFTGLFQIVAHIDQVITAWAAKAGVGGARAWNAAKGAGAGALLGAGVGSVVPFVGTGIGAGVGAGLGGLAGWLQTPNMSGALSVSKNVKLSKQSQEFIQRLQASVAGNWNVTSGMENGGRGHASGVNSHGAGKKFDIGLAGKSTEDIVNLIASVVRTPGFEEAGLETSHSQYNKVIQRLKGMKVDTSGVKDFSNAAHTGDNLDVRSRATVGAPINIIVNGAKDPKAVARETSHVLRTAMWDQDMAGVRL